MSVMLLVSLLMADFCVIPPNTPKTKAQNQCISNLYDCLNPKLGMKSREERRILTKHEILTMYFSCERTYK